MKRRDFKKTKLKAIEPTVNQSTVPVLYQNIGGEVYAFAQVGKEIYFAKVPAEEVQSKNIIVASKGEQAA